MNNWKSLPHVGENLNPAIEILHQASQLMVMVTNAYLPKLEDDSHNNLGWNSIDNLLEGRLIPTYDIQVAFDVDNFKLLIKQKRQQTEIALNGKTKADVIAALKLNFEGLGIDTALLQPISQYSIPPHIMDTGSPFIKPADKDLIEWASYRSHANSILNEIRTNFQWASDVRIWPHHFDTGLYIPVTRDVDGKDIQSIGLGLAIADEYVDEPYFYANYWSKDPVDSTSLRTSSTTGKLNTKVWEGFVLPISFIISSADQQKLVASFFSASINSLLEILK